MHRRHDHGQRHFADLPPSTLLAGGLFTTVVLLAAGCATQAGPDETPAAANPTTSSPATTPTSPSTMSAPTPTSTSVTVAATTATPTELGAAVCYYTTDLDKPDNSTGVAFGYKDGEENVTMWKTSYMPVTIPWSAWARSIRPTPLPPASSRTAR